MGFSRRSFLAGALAAAGATVMPRRKAKAADAPESGNKVSNVDQYATLIDLTKCDGCEGMDTPACVDACHTENADKFPEPDPAMLKNYWPQKKFEDWSKKRHITDRLTPYNWTFVQKVEVEHEGEKQQVSVPRRCMHCDNPPCVKLCPFGVMKKDENGPTHVDTSLCFGGAKCRTVCPWNVPQRQAGVGIYTHLDPMPVGGGVMFKCDMCRDRLAEGRAPACVDACPNGAIQIGEREEIYARAEKLAEEYGGYIYGKDENGGTGTLYVSKVPFEKIDQAIVADAKNPKKVMRMHDPENMLEDKLELSVAAVAAPVIGVAAAFAATVAATEKKTNDSEDSGEESGE